MTSNEVETKSSDGHIVLGSYTAAQEPKAAVLMVHGITADRSEWGYYRTLAESLQKVGISSLAIDLRGHGKSSFNVTKLSLSGALLDIQAAWNLLSYLEKGKNTKKLLIGNSFGGGVTFLFGNQTPSVDHIFLTAPVLSYIDDIGNMAEAWNDRELSTFKYVKFDLSSLLVPEMYYFDKRIIENPSRTSFTIIHGKSDSDVPFADSEAFVANRPAGKLIGLEGMDHCWAKTGDLPPFNDPISMQNRAVAVQETVDQMLSSIE
ncbi:alpha/beta fold hydrolase [Rhodobacteraceae bacterium 63075]|nr:alpha/beta fold hydrolase [Rhodobacteraceae bacterium 63075]